MRALLAELNRRNVPRVAAAYAVFAWIVLQVVDVVGPILELPAWFARVVLLLLAIGFVAALVISWIYELTPEGLKRTDAVLASESGAASTARRLDRMVIAGIAIAIGIILLDRLLPRTGQPGTHESVVDRSVAVLPFTNLAQPAELDPFVDGIHEDLLTQLAKVGSLKVISRTSVQEYRATTKHLRQIAGELGVATILEGGVQRSGTRVRINAQLIDARTDQHLWAETYDRELTAENLFDIQSEIARQITVALRANLLPEEAARIAKASTSNLEALEAYRVALVAIGRGGDDTASLDEADRQIDRAIALDPRFATAYALRAQAALARYWLWNSSPDLLVQARSAIAAGRAIDPGLPELDVAEAYLLYWGERDYPRALALAESAAALVPGDSNATVLRAYILRRLGRWDEAIVMLKRAVELDPRNAHFFTELGTSYEALCDYAAGARAIDSALALDPGRESAHDIKAFMMLETGAPLEAVRAEAALAPPVTRWFVDVWSGNYEAALALSESISGENATMYWPTELVRGLTLKLARRDEEAAPVLASALASTEKKLALEHANPAVLIAQCYALGALGQRERATSACNQALEARPVDAYEIIDRRRLAAASLAMAGESGRAIELIDAWLSEPPSCAAVRVGLDPAFASLRDDPRFREVVERHRWRGNVPPTLRPPQ